MKKALNFGVQKGLLFFLNDLIFLCSIFMFGLFVVLFVMRLVNVVFIQSFGNSISAGSGTILNIGGCVGPKNMRTIKK